ncbi:MAG: DUF3108 domain-containing protein [Gammaproteobacteria bacterium]|nr:DUF3108 domain-containing protein [Gammaproteobacteria bacterium]
MMRFTLSLLLLAGFATASANASANSSAGDGAAPAPSKPAAAQPEAAPTSGGDRAAPSWEPGPFKARYRVTYEGVPITATGTRELIHGDNGDFHFASRVSAFMAHMEESAHFTQDDDGTLRPVTYAERRSGLIGSRNRQLSFDWSVPELVRSGDQQAVQPLDGLVYDPVSWQLALQRDLSRGDYKVGDSFFYQVSSGGEPDEYELRVMGTPSLSVPAGDFKTVLLRREHESDRETWIWVAPEHDYLLVRLEHVDGRRLTLALEAILEP